MLRKEFFFSIKKYKHGIFEVVALAKDKAVYKKSFPHKAYSYFI